MGPTIFQEMQVPREARLVGWAALVQKFDVAAIVRKPSCISSSFVLGSRREEGDWIVFDKRFGPEDTLAGHLTFAMRNETIDLLVLKRFFDRIPADDIATLVRNERTGAATRRVWFYFERLTGVRLAIPDATIGNYVDALDPEVYFTSKPVNSPRHRVRDNLLGTPDFCPVVRKTPYLAEVVDQRWDVKAKELVGRISKAVVARAASFLLLADTQASYQIEGERPPRNRLERWMRAISQAGRLPLSTEELVRLQHIVIEDMRFVRPGLRVEGGFIGDRDNLDNNPLPEFISARPEDLPGLLEGLLAANERMSKSDIDAVLQASVVAFGFVFIHPFVDGNGRIHRYLIHDVLTRRGYTPPGMTFPVSSVLADRIQDYASTLREFTGPLMPLIQWAPTAQRNVHVVNDTADLYRFGDYTPIAEFLYACVIQTITVDLPREIGFLKRFDEAKTRIGDVIELPDAMVSQIVNMVRQNNGRLSQKRRKGEFAAMSDSEVAQIEEIIGDAFEKPENDMEQDEAASFGPP